MATTTRPAISQCCFSSFKRILGSEIASWRSFCLAPGTIAFAPHFSDRISSFRWTPHPARYSINFDGGRYRGDATFVLHLQKFTSLVVASKMKDRLIHGNQIFDPRIGMDNGVGDAYLRSDHRRRCRRFERGLK